MLEYLCLFFTADVKLIMLIGVTVLVLSITFASLFTLITMLFQNKAIIAVSCILLSFGLLLAGAICNRMLDAPPTIPAYSIGENGETTAQETENPKYSDGTKREIVQSFMMSIQVVRQFNVQQCSLSI